MEVKDLIKELQSKRAGLAAQLQKIDTALNALGALNGIVDEPGKVWVTRRGKTAEVSTFGQPHPRDFAIDYIRRKGKEISGGELFEQYNKLIGRTFATKEERMMYRGRFMANFQHADKYGLTKKLYKLEGVGKEIYINVNSAMLLQSEKQQPGQTITHVRH